MSEESAKMVEENNTFGIPAVQERKMNNGHTARTINEDKKKAMPEEYFRWGIFGITVLLLFMAAIEFYFSMQEAIRTWFE
ncbi:MAG: hypothetical protein Q8J68_03265 [Methanolobus sp.]|uniref:hypothetical protein n=1 Tax=Methanolobus sp. TaxID=1874737 RepID=UPI002730D122|nr:hypothetical protein [Methanolobus sp.]MDP2216291.1 hypothetical protein [Methanolobus sp.]